MLDAFRVNYHLHCRMVPAGLIFFWSEERCQSYEAFSSVQEDCYWMNIPFHPRDSSCHLLRTKIGSTAIDYKQIPSLQGCKMDEWALTTQKKKYLSNIFCGRNKGLIHWTAIITYFIRERMLTSNSAHYKVGRQVLDPLQWLTSCIIMNKFWCEHSLPSRGLTVVTSRVPTNVY